MKKIIICLSVFAFSNLFSQITLSSSMPTSINSGASFDVEVKITKGTVSNFAKYQIDVPAGYSVSSIDAKNGNFTFENKRAKIVWVAIPSEPEFTIKFKVQANNDAVSPGTFSQKFYYLENNEKKEVEGTPVTITIGGAVASNSSPEKKSDTPPAKVDEPVVATPTKTVAPPPVPEKKEENVASTTPAKTVQPAVPEKKVETPVETKPAKTVEEPIAENKSKETDSSAKKSAPSQSGLTYKIQLSSSASQPNKSLYSKAGSIEVENVDGLYKVVTGNYTNKDEAIARLVELKGKGLNGFLVKYENGKRIK